MQIGDYEISWLDDPGLGTAFRGHADKYVRELLDGFRLSRRSRTFEPEQALILLLGVAIYRLAAPINPQTGLPDWAITDLASTWDPEETELPNSGRWSLAGMEGRVSIRGFPISGPEGKEIGRRPAIYRETAVLGSIFCWWPFKPHSTRIEYGGMAASGYESLRDSLATSVVESNTLLEMLTVVASTRRNLASTRDAPPVGTFAASEFILEAISDANDVRLRELLRVVDSTGGTEAVLAVE